MRAGEAARGGLLVRYARTSLAGALLALALLARPLTAQELEPRAYSPAPIGTNFLILGYSYQTGEVVFDPASPISDVSASVNTANLSYGRSFNLFGRLATAAFAVPGAWGAISGNVFEERRSVTRSGLADVRGRFAVNLIGGPALTPKEFAARTPATTLGFSLVVSAPTGEYDRTKLINLGTHRWAFKPELGLSSPIGRWTLEAAAGVWLFAHNDRFYPGTVERSQDPLWTAQGHVGYTFRPQLWVALDATYYTGGRTYADGARSATRQDNSRLGATLSVPLKRGHTIKLLAARGVTARVGSRFDTYSVAYQFLWLD